MLILEREALHFLVRRVPKITFSSQSWHVCIFAEAVRATQKARDIVFVFVFVFCFFHFFADDGRTIGLLLHKKGISPI